MQKTWEQTQLCTPAVHTAKSSSKDKATVGTLASALEHSWGHWHPDTTLCSCSYAALGCLAPMHHPDSLLQCTPAAPATHTPHRHPALLHSWPLALWPHVICPILVRCCPVRGGPASHQLASPAAWQHVACVPDGSPAPSSRHGPQQRRGGRQRCRVTRRCPTE